ncbi:MAG: hypothetical protein JSV09_16405 [Thermoplasmata archaeon]|nr:MAG: hypothetical protein JSV09_16405 [Thermoplasmata archaeon]
MGYKIRAFCFLAILLVSLVCSLYVTEGTGAEEEEMNDIALYMYGDPGNATLNTSYGHYEEQLVLTTTSSLQHAPIPNVIFLGEWVTKPISYQMMIQGELMFAVYAMGDLQGVTFLADLTINGVIVNNQPMNTQTQDLNDTYPVEYISEPVNLTQPLDLNTSDTIGLRLSLTHNDIPYHPIYGGKNVTLVFGYGFGSMVTFATNSIHISEIIGRDNPVTGNMIVTATIKCSFGYEDLNYATAKSNHGSFTKLSETVIDNATVEIEWEWDYTVSEGGSYTVTIRARDMNYNTWERTEEVHITTPNTEIDFSITNTDISFSTDPKKDVNTTISAKIKGSGRRWSSYQVEIEFYEDSTLLDEVKATISRGGTNEVTLLWVPDSSGTHRIKVKIDPEDDFYETDESNNEATKNVDVKEGSGGSGTPGFESIWLIAAIGVVLFLGLRSRRDNS